MPPSKASVRFPHLNGSKSTAETPRGTSSKFSTEAHHSRGQNGKDAPIAPATARSLGRKKPSLEDSTSTAPFATSPKTSLRRDGTGGSRRQGNGHPPTGSSQEQPRRKSTAIPSQKHARAKAPSFHVLKLVDDGNVGSESPGSPSVAPGNGETDSVFGEERHSQAQPQPFSDTGMSLRSQLHALDPSLLRTFDSKTGTVAVNKKDAIPKREHLVRKKYTAFFKNQAKLQEAEELVGRLSVAQRRNYAIQSVRRKHVEELARILKKDVFSPEVALSRINVSLQMSLEHIIGHLDSDTKELSLIRMQAAAADTVLWKEAERIADAEIQNFNSKVIPEGTTAVQLMSMAIDSFRERFVPIPPREVVTPQVQSPPPAKPSARLARRPSGVLPSMFVGPSPNVTPAATGLKPFPGVSPLPGSVSKDNGSTTPPSFSFGSRSPAPPGLRSQRKRGSVVLLSESPRNNSIDGSRRSSDNSLSGSGIVEAVSVVIDSPVGDGRNDARYI